MARLNNLLVTGITRFLNKIKTPKVETDVIETDNIVAANGKINIGEIPTLSVAALKGYYGSNGAGGYLYDTGSNGQVLTNVNGNSKWQDVTTDSIKSGTLSIARGGTGQTTAQNAANTFAAALPAWTATLTDDTYYISQDTGGTATFGRRKTSVIWTYIKDKISSWMKNNTSKGPLGYGTSVNDNNMPITSNTLAFWDGQYNSGSSNLSYCSRGAFGTAAIATTATTVNNDSTLPTGAAVQNYFKSGGTVNGTLDVQNQLSANSITAGQLLVNGNATFTNGLTGNLTGNVTGNLSGQAYEANLIWGGRNFAAGYGCVDAAMVSELGANRFALIQSGVTIEYSRDSGSTWTDYGASTESIKKLFGPDNQWPNIYIGKADSNNQATSAYQLRITIDTGTAQVYSVLNKFIILISTNGSQNCKVTIQKALQSTPTTYENVASNVSISGWSGYNVINVSAFTTYGNSASVQYGRIRFIFSQGSTNGSYSGMNIGSIKAFGGVGWTTPSTLAKTGHLYKYDYSGKAIFEKQVQANGFDITNTTMNTFGVCSTAAATEEKTVSVTPFSLVDGARVTVYFENQNTSTYPYLNVSNTGKKTIWINNVQVVYSQNNTNILFGALDFVFHYDRWHIIGGVR